MNMNFLNDLENLLLNRNYKIYKSTNDEYLYKKTINTLEESVLVLPTFVILRVQDGMKEHQSFYPLSDEVINNFEQLMSIERNQLYGGIK